MEMLLERLLRQAHLFDDPATYEAGVRDALDALGVRAENEARTRAA